MEHLSRSAVHAAEPAYLRCPQGWAFFLETYEIAAGRWRSGVRIHATDPSLIMRIQCRNDRATAAEALRDAQDCARTNLGKLEQRRTREIAAGNTAAPSCDERRKIEMLRMAFLRLDHDPRQPLDRTAAVEPSRGDADAYADLARQSRALRDKSCALIDALRMPRECSEAIPSLDSRHGENCRIGKKGSIER